MRTWYPSTVLISRSPGPSPGPSSSPAPALVSSSPVSTRTAAGGPPGPRCHAAVPPAALPAAAAVAVTEA